jgi:hypothetical protein
LRGRGLHYGISSTVEVALPRIDFNALALVFEQLVPLLNMHTGPWIAGGCVHRIFAGMIKNGAYDVDIFCADACQADRVGAAVADIISPIKIQVIQDRFFESAQHLIDDFDFTVVQFATDGKTVICDEHSLQDIKTKRLRLNELSDIRAPYRLSKYCGLGYQPDADTVQNSLKATGVYYIVEEMKMEDGLELDFEYTEMMRVKSALADMWMQNINGKPYVFFEGHPMPLRLGFPLVALYSETAQPYGLETQRNLIYRYLAAWKSRFGLKSYTDVWRFSLMLQAFSTKQLADAYSWMASTT